MDPRVVFLGTGQGPEVVGKQLRGSGGIIVQTKDNQFHIDPGPGSLVMAKNYGINPRETSCLLVSHNHVNHCSDLNPCIHAMTYGGLDKKGVLIAENSVINGDETEKPCLSNFHKGLIEKYVVLKTGQRVGIDDVEIRATKSQHSTSTIGFLMTAPDFALSYLSDTSYVHEIPEEHEGSEVLILNVVNPGSTKTDENLNSETAVKIINKLNPRLAVLTHFSIKMLQADPLIEAREIAKQTKSQIVAASDGLSFSLSSYSSRRKQKTLSSF
jgi:ribonuclease BN (tRNA processing enzyme)